MEGLKCPHCGDATAFTPIYLTRQRVLDYVSGTGESATNPQVVAAVMPEYWSGIRYALLRCQSCEHLFVVEETLASTGWFVVYPIPHKAVANEISQPIKGEFEEACLCFAIGAYMACVAMCQITLESLWQNQKVSGLNQLRDDGIISQRLWDRATEIRLWGDIVKHEPLAEPISKDDARELLTYLEDILNHVYAEPAHYKARKQKREQMGKRSAKK
jgi:hypothetical protein